VRDHWIASEWKPLSPQSGLALGATEADREQRMAAGAGDAP